MAVYRTLVWEDILRTSCESISNVVEGYGKLTICGLPSSVATVLLLATLTGRTHALCKLRANMENVQCWSMGVQAETFDEC